MKYMFSFLTKNLLVILALNIFSSTNLRADEKPLKIAIVNTDKVIMESAMSKDLLKKSDDKQKELYNKLIKKKQKIENEFKSIESKRAVLSGEELQRKATALQEEYKQLQMDEGKYTQILNQARMYALQEVQEIVSKAVNKISVGKYDLAIMSSVLLYIDMQKFTDITSDVIKKTNDIQKSIDYETIFKKTEKDFEKILKGEKNK